MEKAKEKLAELIEEIKKESCYGHCEYYKQPFSEDNSPCKGCPLIAIMKG